MKTLNIIIKSLKEQLRSFWVLLLTLSMGPFFIFIYYLITETSKPQYDIHIVNYDTGAISDGQEVNHGEMIASFFSNSNLDVNAVPFKVTASKDKETAIEKVKKGEIDALIVIDHEFSQSLEKQRLKDMSSEAGVEFIGDLTKTNYLISAVWANEVLNEYTLMATNNKRIINVKETALGSSGSMSDFQMMVPGLLIVSLIMLMFTASIAFVSEVENKTIIRLKLSKLTTLQFLAGNTIVQLMVGVFSVILTLIIALMLGYNYSGSLFIMVLVAGLTSLSIIAFSLIIAAVTKTAGEVLVVGNFPMFLFMFFTGAAFPLKSEPWFTVAGYPVSLQGLMTPTHAISALNKTLTMDMGFGSIIPEITAILILTVIYFIIGAIIFKRRHLKLV